MIGRLRHVGDDRLLDCYYAQRRSERVHPPTAEHLSDCAACSARFDELSAFMDAVRAEGDSDTDALFSAEHLRAQQLRLAHRLEAVGRPARIISFPRRLATGAMAASAARTVPRWTAGAAAAGLFLGIVLGASYEWEWHGRLGAPLASHTASARASDADDAFLSELELAAERPRTRELAAVDAFTPHVREIRDVR